MHIVLGVIGNLSHLSFSKACQPINFNSENEIIGSLILMNEFIFTYRSLKIDLNPKICINDLSSKKWIDFFFSKASNISSVETIDKLNRRSVKRRSNKRNEMKWVRNLMRTIRCLTTQFNLNKCLFLSTWINWSEWVPDHITSVYKARVKMIHLFIIIWYVSGCSENRHIFNIQLWYLEYKIFAEIKFMAVTFMFCLPVSIEYLLNLVSNLKL